MVNPLVSIVLPTFNGEAHLEEAVQNCLAQTYANWELIIVDDASTDDTPSLIRRFLSADRRVRAIRHATNRKLPAALNTGFSEAQGAYLTWTSDDNCYRPDALAQLVSFLEAHPEVDLVYSDFTVINDAGEPIAHRRVEDPDGLVTENRVGACFLYRRILYEVLGGYAEDLFLAEDYDFWLRASGHFHLQPLHEDLYLYRRHSASLTSLKTAQILSSTSEALKRNIPLLKWPTRSMRANSYLRIAGAEEAANDDNISSLRYVLRAIACWPPVLTRRRTLGLLLYGLSGKKGVSCFRKFSLIAYGIMAILLCYRAISLTKPRFNDGFGFEEVCIPVRECKDR